MTRLRFNNQIQFMSKFEWFVNQNVQKIMPSI